MTAIRLLLGSGCSALSLLLLNACASVPGPQAEKQTPQNNAVVRSVTTMTGSTGRARDAAGAMNQRSAEAAAAANAVQ
jgi:hypothetical protein